MKWKKIASMEYGKIVFHSIPCPVAGTDLIQLPFLVAEEFMDMTAEPINIGGHKSVNNEANFFTNS